MIGLHSLKEGVLKKLFTFIPKMKKIIVTFRFSILSIFLSLFVVYTAAIICITSYRFSTIISYTAFNLMETLSHSVFEKINAILHRVTMLSAFSANLIKHNTLPQDDLRRIMEYTFYLLDEEKRYPITSTIEGVAWADEQGNYVWSQRQPDGSVMSEVTDRTSNPIKVNYYYRSTQGQIIKTNRSNDPLDLDYDARERSWYKKAMAFKKTSLTDVGQYYHSNLFGLSVLSPVFSDTGKPVGVFEIDIQLLFLKNFIEHLKTSDNGLVFVLNEKEDVLAFPHRIPYQGSSLLKVSDLSSPSVIKSFNEYKRTRADKFTFEVEGKRYLAVYKRIPRPEVKNDLIIGIVAPEDDFLGDLFNMYLSTLLFSLLIFVFGLLLVSYFVNKLVKPLKKITVEIQKIKNFDLRGDSRVVSNISEVIAISDTVQAMKIGLRSFQKYVPSVLVKQLIKLGEDAHIGGVKKNLVVFFSDIEGFTSIAENEDPEFLSQHLSDYLSRLSDIILQEQGTIDKYSGDSIMAFWGAPVPQEEPAALAVTAALRCQQKLTELNEQWVRENKPVFLTHMGIHEGPVIVGNIGSEDRMNYTVIGDVVNHASRLENVNRQYGTKIIVSQAIYSNLQTQFVFRFVDRVCMKGRVEVENIYEVLAANRSEITFDLEQYTSHFDAGFLFYDQSKWSEAINAFNQCLIIYPDDTLAPVFLARCQQFLLNPRAAD